MKISIENYEAWMLDFVEGRLSGKELAEFENFLLRHPELRSDLDAADLTPIMPDERFFDQKNLLKAKIIKEVVEEEDISCFEATEGIMPVAKAARFEKRLQSSERLREKLDQFQATRLVPDETIVYPGKELLKRGQRTAYLFFKWAAGIAAGLAILLVIFNLDSAPAPQVAVKKPAAPPVTRKKPEPAKTVVPMAPAKPAEQEGPAQEGPVNEKPAIPAEPKETRALARVVPARKSETTHLNTTSRPVPARRKTPEQQGAAPEMPVYETAVTSGFNPPAESVEPLKESLLFAEGKKLVGKISNDRWKLEKKRNQKGDAVLVFNSRQFGFTAPVKN